MKKVENYKCTGCGTRYAATRKSCFYCGKTDTIRFDQIKKVKKDKKPYHGAINIKVN